jgi:hypothetical protein
MPSEMEAVERISRELKEVYVRIMGKPPDPRAVQEEAEAMVAKYGPQATLEDLMT